MPAPKHMVRLTAWKARRAGPSITIEHSTGKVVGVDRIEVTTAGIIATDKNGVSYELSPVALT